jgi:predicted HAD superfamily phosphohydrolase YqeG
MAVYVDVDDTLIRSFGSKRIPMTEMVAFVRSLKQQGATLYCWSSGGADYARRSAEELGLADCFVACLPKPHLLIDDIAVDKWRMRQLHPNECRGVDVPELAINLNWLSSIPAPDAKRFTLTEDD